MKTNVLLIICGLTLLLAPKGAIAASSYNLLSFPHERVDEFLTIGSDDTSTPPSLQGLWWMDGNPASDEVLSFAGATFSPIEDDGKVVGYEALIPVYEEGIWSWHDTFKGRLTYRAVEASKLVYRATFNEDFTHSDVEPVVGPLSLKIPQSVALSFTMTQISEDEWVRDSLLLGQTHQYVMRQIVDGNGNRLPAYDDFVESVMERNLPRGLVSIRSRK